MGNQAFPRPLGDGPDFSWLLSRPRRALTQLDLGTSGSAKLSTRIPSARGHRHCGARPDLRLIVIKRSLPACATPVPCLCLHLTFQVSPMQKCVMCFRNIISCSSLNSCSTKGLLSLVYRKGRKVQRGPICPSHKTSQP